MSEAKRVVSLTPSNLRKMAQRSSGNALGGNSSFVEWNTPVRTFFSLSVGVLILVAATGMVQSIASTVIKRTVSGELTDDALSNIIIGMQVAMACVSTLVSVLLDSDRLRAYGEVAPNALSDTIAFGIVLMDLVFQRTLIGVVESLDVVATTLALRLGVQFILGPGSLTWCWHRGTKAAALWIGACGRKQKKSWWRDMVTTFLGTVEDDGSLDGSSFHDDGSVRSQATVIAGVSEDAESSEFLLASERRLVVQLYSKICEVLSLFSWIGYALIYSQGWNRSVAAFKDMESFHVDLTHMVSVAGIIIAFEGVVILALWLQARRVRPWLWRRAVGRIIRAPRALQAALVLMAVHVIMDVGVAMVRAAE